VSEKSYVKRRLTELAAEHGWDVKHVEAVVEGAWQPEPLFRVVNTDNFGGDYPDERFFIDLAMPRTVAVAICDKLNERVDDTSSRIYKVVADGYTLQPRV